MELVERIKHVMQHIFERVEKGQIKPLCAVPVPQMNATTNVRT